MQILLENHHTKASINKFTVPLQKFCYSIMLIKILYDTAVVVPLFFVSRRKSICTVKRNAIKFYINIEVEGLVLQIHIDGEKCINGLFKGYIWMKRVFRHKHFYESIKETIN